MFTKLTSQFVLPGVHPVLLGGLLDGPEMGQDPDEVAKVDDVTGLVAFFLVVAGNAATLKQVCAPETQKNTIETINR